MQIKLNYSLSDYKIKAADFLDDLMDQGFDLDKLIVDEPMYGSSPKGADLMAGKTAYDASGFEVKGSDEKKFLAYLISKLKPVRHAKIWADGKVVLDNFHGQTADLGGESMSKAAQLLRMMENTFSPGKDDDGKWYVYDGNDKQVDGPFDTEAEADKSAKKMRDFDMNDPNRAPGESKSEASDFDAKSLAKMFGGNEKDGRAHFPVSKWDQVVKYLDQKYGKHEDTTDDSDYSKSFTWSGKCGAAVTGNNMMVMGSGARLESKNEEEGTPFMQVTKLHVGDRIDAEEGILWIDDIRVESIHMPRPTIIVSYRYKTQTASGKGSNELSAFKDTYLK